MRYILALAIGLAHIWCLIRVRKTDLLLMMASCLLQRSFEEACKEHIFWKKTPRLRFAF